MKKKYIFLGGIVTLFVLNVLYIDRRFYYANGHVITVWYKQIIFGCHLGFQPPKTDYIDVSANEVQINFVDERQFVIATFGGGADSAKLMPNLKNYTCVAFYNNDYKGVRYQKYPILGSHAWFRFYWDWGKYYPLIVFPISDNKYLELDGDMFGMFNWRIKTLTKE